MLSTLSRRALPIRGRSGALGARAFSAEASFDISGSFMVGVRQHGALTASFRHLVTLLIQKRIVCCDIFYVLVYMYLTPVPLDRRFLLSQTHKLDTAPSENVTISKEELLSMFELMYTMRRMVRKYKISTGETISWT
jgi:hypothetical protein